MYWLKIYSCKRVEGQLTKLYRNIDTYKCFLRIKINNFGYYQFSDDNAEVVYVGCDECVSVS